MCLTRRPISGFSSHSTASSTHTGRVAPDRVIAGAVVAVLIGGVAVAATHGDEAKPVAAARPAPTMSPPPASTAVPTVTETPTPAATHKSPSRRPAPAAKPLFPLPAAPAFPRPCPPPPIPPGPPVKPPKPAVKAPDLPPIVRVPQHRSVNLAPVTGKGMWLTTWPDTHLDVAAVVARARRAGLNQLWVRTGGSYQGWYGDRLLPALLPAAHAAGIRVIAWDFPTLSDPLEDVARVRHVLGETFGGQRIDGFSPDIETLSEGTFNSPRRVAIYLSRVRALAGNVPVIATVLQPTPTMLASYPYRAEAPYVDAFAPMVYWSCTEPGAAVRRAIVNLARLRPVHVIGQSFDMGSMGGRLGLPSAREIWRFLDVAKRRGAVGASLYLYDQTHRPQWKALTRYPWEARHYISRS